MFEWPRGLKYLVWKILSILEKFLGIFYNLLWPISKSTCHREFSPAPLIAQTCYRGTWMRQARLSWMSPPCLLSAPLPLTSSFVDGHHVLDNSVIAKLGKYVEKVSEIFCVHHPGLMENYYLQCALLQHPVANGVRPFQMRSVLEKILLDSLKQNTSGISFHNLGCSLLCRGNSCSGDRRVELGWLSPKSAVRCHLSRGISRKKHTFCISTLFKFTKALEIDL